MIGITRGISTLVGAGIAGFLIWLAAQMGSDTAGAYWATYGLVAAAGVTMALSQIVGGWTKWGWPRLTPGVFVLAFLPALLVGGWVLLARQPAQFFNTANWSRDLGLRGVVGDLGEMLGALAFGIGLIFGLTFDTAGPRQKVVVAPERVTPTPAAVPPRPAQPVEPRPVEQEPVEREPVGREHMPETEPVVVEPVADDALVADDPVGPADPAEPEDVWVDDRPVPPRADDDPLEGDERRA